MKPTAKPTAAGRGPDEVASAAGDRRSRPWARLLRGALALVLLVLVVRAVDWRRFVEVAADVVPAWILAAALVAAVDRVWMAAKWVWLLRGLGVRPSLLDAVQQYVVGSLVGMATQFFVAGDVTRALTLGRRVGRTQTVVASVVLERAIGVATSGLQASAALVVLALTVDLGTWSPLLVPVLGGTLAAAAAPVLAFARPVRRLLERLAPGMPRPVQRSLADYLELGRRLGRMRGVIAGFTTLTLAEQFMPLLLTWVLARAFGIALGPLELFMTVPVIMFFARLPISTQSIGLQEGLFVLLLGLLGLTPAESFAISLASRVVELTVNGLAAVGFLLWWRGPARR